MTMYDSRDSWSESYWNKLYFVSFNIVCYVQLCMYVCQHFIVSYVNVTGVGCHGWCRLRHALNYANIICYGLLSEAGLFDFDNIETSMISINQCRARIGM